MTLRLLDRTLRRPRVRARLSKQPRLFRQIGKWKSGQQALEVHGGALGQLKRPLQFDRMHQFSVPQVVEHALLAVMAKSQTRNGWQWHYSVEALRRTAFANEHALNGCVRQQASLVRPGCRKSCQRGGFSDAHSSNDHQSPIKDRDRI